MLVFYIPICFPDESTFFNILDIFEKNHLKMVEIGIPVENAYLDGALIQNTNKELLAKGLTPQKELFF